MKLKYCQECQKEIKVPNWKLKSYKNRPANKHFFCSRKCYEKYWKREIGQKREKHWKWKGGNLVRKCEYCHKTFTIQRKGKDRKYKFCSKECLYKWLKGKFTEKNNPNWKGSPPTGKRTESLYLKWRRKVVKRDKYKCKNCESKDNLEAHHIKSYIKYSKSRYAIDNGITLCRKCHISLHKTQK